LPSRTKRESRKRSRFFFRVEYRGVEQLVARRAQAVKLDRLMNVFINFGSEIHLVEADKRQRKPVSSAFRDAWDLILQRAVPVEMPE
jgi:hypothetical protein